MGRRNNTRGDQKWLILKITSIWFINHKTKMKYVYSFDVKGLIELFKKLGFTEIYINA